MKLTTNTIIIVIGILALMFLACIPLSIVAANMLSTRPDSAIDVVATVQAMATPTTLPVTQAPPTETSLPPTPTSIPPTHTPVPSPTHVSICDWASFVKDVTMPDGTALVAGETFTKTWRLSNRGTFTWTPDYMLVFNSGAQMGGTTAVRLSAYVAPGQTVDVSVTLTAPVTSGHHIGYWILRNPAGVLFGSGDKADKAFYVDIYTQEQYPHGTVTGSLCYPSEFNPPLTIYFEKADNSEVIQFSIPENHMNFSFLLPNGTYYVRAWAPNYNLEGAYVHPERTMKSFVVNGGQTTSGINSCDWDIYPHSRGQ